MGKFSEKTRKNCGATNRKNLPQKIAKNLVGFLVKFLVIFGSIFGAFFGRFLS